MQFTPLELGIISRALLFACCRAKDKGDLREAKQCGDLFHRIVKQQKKGN